jgi:hypothetical protein
MLLKTLIEFNGVNIAQIKVHNVNFNLNTTVDTPRGAYEKKFKLQLASLTKRSRGNSIFLQ